MESSRGAKCSPLTLENLKPIGKNNSSMMKITRIEKQLTKMLS